MMQNTIVAYVYDFLSVCIELKGMAEKVENIILFGSVARGDFDKESDVDIFIDIAHLDEKKQVEELVSKAIVIFEAKARKTWNLRKIELPVKPIVGKLAEEKWSDIKYEIDSSGIFLFGRYRELPEKLQPYALISYSLRTLKQSKKMQFLRKMYGYKTKKGKKIYEGKGIVAEIGCRKMTTNQIMIKTENAKKVLEIIKDFKIPYSLKEIWTR